MVDREASSQSSGDSSLGDRQAYSPFLFSLRDFRVHLIKLLSTLIMRRTDLGDSRSVSHSLNRSGQCVISQ